MELGNLDINKAQSLPDFVAASPLRQVEKANVDIAFLFSDPLIEIYYEAGKEVPYNQPLLETKKEYD